VTITIHRIVNSARKAVAEGGALASRLRHIVKVTCGVC